MEAERLKLLPNPKRVEFEHDGLPCALTSGWRIAIPAELLHELFPIAERLQGVLRDQVGLEVEIAAAAPGEADSPRIAFLPASMPLHREGYVLQIGSGRIDIRYGGAAGAFHAVSTLKQLLAQYGKSVPAIRIEDEPDFPARGIMLDISRNKIPKLDTLFRVVDLMADVKMNQLQLYIEGFSFAYGSFPQVWEGGTPMTGEDMLRLDRYCEERFIELVPNQNSFGHMTPWLTRREFNDMAECPSGSEAPWGPYDKPISLDPTDPRCESFLARTYDDLLPYFTSSLFNVGCDETFDLGQGKSKEACERLGKGRVYLSFLLKVYELARKRGKRMMFWGDIIKQYPELIPELPKDAIALEWGYHASAPTAENCAKFRDAGIPFYVCPGTSSWNSIAGLTDNMKANLWTAAVNGLAHGAIGYLVTDWGDCGHWQPLPVSYAGFVYGAALSWGAEGNREADVAAYLDRYVYADDTGIIGRFSLDLGNYYKEECSTKFNGSGIFRMLYYHQLEDTNTDLHFLKLPDLERDDYDRVKRYVAGLLDTLETAVPRCGDAETVLAEYRLAIRMISHGAELGLFKTEALSDPAEHRARLESLRDDLASILSAFRELWLVRNRRGGLEESVAKLQALHRQYVDAIIDAADAPDGMVSIRLFDVNTPETDVHGSPYGCPADSFLITMRESGETRYILLDGAKKGQGEKVILPYLLANGITTLDCVILSHAHNDHFGGLVDLLNDDRFTVKQFVYCPIDDETVRLSDDEDNYRFWMELRERLRGLPNVLELDESHIGTNLRFGPELALDIVSTPDRTYLREHRAVNLNDFNLVLRLRYGRFTALMTGDCGEYQAEQILRSPQKGMIESVTMLKAAHHGGDASTTPEFIRECNARIVLIPCNATVVEHRPSFVRNAHLFGRLGAKLLRADWARSIEVTTDGGSVECVLEAESFRETTRMALG